MKPLFIRSERRAGVILSYAQTALSIVIALFYVPIMLGALGKQEYGLYQTVSSVVATLAVLDLGFGGAYTHFYFRQKNDKTDGDTAALNGLFIIVYSVLGTVAFLCCAYLCRHLDLIFGNELSAEEYKKAKTMLLLLSLNLLTSFASGAFSAYIKTQEKFVFSELLSLIRTAASPTLQLPFLMLGFGSVGITAARFAVNFICDTAIIIFAVSKLRFRASFSRRKSGLFRSILAFSSLIALNMIVDQINSNVDNIILARICGTAEVAVNSVGVMIASYYSLFSTSVSKVYTPQIHRIVNDTEPSAQKSALTDIFIRVGRIQLIILMLILSGFIVFGRDFIALWAGDGYETAYAVCLLRMLPSTVPLIQNVGIEIQRAQRRHHYRAFIYSGMALANIAMTIPLARRFGAIGAALATGAAAFFANGIIMNVIYHKKISIDIVRFWKSILSALGGMLPSFALGIILIILVDFTSWISLILGIAAYSVVYLVSVWLFSLDPQEKTDVKDFLRIKKYKSRP